MRYKDIIILELENALKETKSVRMYKRYSVVLKHFQGFSNRDIPAIECLEEHTINKYIKTYTTQGIDGLSMKKPTGDPRKICWGSKRLKKCLDSLADHILLDDEQMICDNQAIQKIWFTKGVERKIWCRGLLSFFKNTLVKYESGKIVMILDNARIHHAKLIQPFLGEDKDR